MSAGLFNRVALIGLGLIGSSLAHIIRREKLADHIAGFAPSEATRARVRALGFVDSVHDSAQQAVAGADFVMLCAPPGAFAEITSSIQDDLTPGAIISDVGSFKEKAISDIAPHLPRDIHFVPAHPIAGTEFSGPDAGFAELFENRWVILTPLADSNAPYQAAVRQVKNFWEKAGSKITVMSPSHHDRVLALTSHLPHVIAWTIVALAEHIDDISEKEVIAYSGGGFRDFTRLAASDPVMWRDVLLGNRAPVLEVLDHFMDDLQTIRAAIEKSDGAFLQDLFSRTRSVRQKIIEAGQETSLPDFGRKP